jgi:hypothetical protein
MRRCLPLLLLLLAAAAAAQTNIDAATAAYAPREIEGWRVWVSPRLQGETNVCAETLRQLDDQLYRIAQAVPAPALARNRGIADRSTRPRSGFPGCVYHESPDWLREHGLNPDKAGGVEIANADHFIRCAREQPCQVLHELAHGYYHRFLADGRADVRRCYERARAAGRYQSVLRANGRRERHYALTGEKEYFAEATEAFFGTNDFYPFVRAELKEYDPDLYALLCRSWGVEPE